MEITRTAKPVKNLADLNVWHCPGCGVVHLAVGATVLNFSRDEFAIFAESVVDIQCSGWARTGEENSIIDLISGNRDGETVHSFVVH